MDREPRTSEAQSIPRSWNVWDSSPGGPWSRDAFAVSSEQECSLEQIQSEAVLYLENTVRSDGIPLLTHLKKYMSQDYAKPIDERNPNWTVNTEISSILAENAMVFAKRVAQKYGIVPGRAVTQQLYYKPDQNNKIEQLISIRGRDAYIGNADIAGRIGDQVRATDIYETRVADAFLDVWYEKGIKMLEEIEKPAG